MGGKDGGWREVLRKLTGEALEGGRWRRWRKETTHMQQVRFIRNTRFQGYPTIIPILLSLSSPPWPTTIISDFLVHRFIPIQFFPSLLAGRHLPSIIYMVMVSSISCLFGLLYIYILSSRHADIGSDKFSLRFCWLHYTYIQPRLPLTFKYFSAMKVLPIPPLFSPDCCVFVLLCLTLVRDVGFMSGWVVYCGVGCRRASRSL